jgi:hypothetical protein
MGEREAESSLPLDLVYFARVYIAPGCNETAFYLFICAIRFL